MYTYSSPFDCFKRRSPYLSGSGRDAGTSLKLGGGAGKGLGSDGDWSRGPRTSVLPIPKFNFLLGFRPLFRPFHFAKM